MTTAIMDIKMTNRDYQNFNKAVKQIEETRKELDRLMEATKTSTLLLNLIAKSILGLGGAMVFLTALQLWTML